MPIPIYSINELSQSLGNANVLTINKFDIHRGACYVFEGPMGCGKTTLLDILYSRKKIQKGEIRFEEKEIYKYTSKDYSDQIAIAPQFFTPPWGTVRNYLLKTFKKYSHIKDTYKRLDEIGKKMSMTNLYDRKMRSLTPCELRWVVLGAQIGADSKVLFIDEFEQHLGKNDLQTILTILHRKINYDGVTVIATTQNKDLLSRISSVIITLDNGRITSVRSSVKKRDRYKGNRRKK